jgi:hypothetical protein
VFSTTQARAHYMLYFKLYTFSISHYLLFKNIYFNSPITILLVLVYYLLLTPLFLSISVFHSLLSRLPSPLISHPFSFSITPLSSSFLSSPFSLSQHADNGRSNTIRTACSVRSTPQHRHLTQRPAQEEARPVWCDLCVCGRVCRGGKEGGRR